MVYFVGGIDFVDVVFFQCLFWGQRKARPDNIIGFDWGNVECAFLSSDIVGVVGIGEITTGKVVEVSSLSIENSISQ